MNELAGRPGSTDERRAGRLLIDSFSAVARKIDCQDPALAALLPAESQGERFWEAEAEGVRL
jgi:hypothetical protein